MNYEEMMELVETALLLYPQMKVFLEQVEGNDEQRDFQFDPEPLL